MSIGNLSSAPDQAGPRSELDHLMDLHLSLPDGLATGWSAAAPQASATELVQQTDEGDDEGGTGATIASFLPLLLIVVAVYFLLLRPRQRQQRQQRELQSNLDVGDEVMLTSGVYGFITAFEPGSDVVWVEIDDDVQIRVSRAAVSGKVTTSGAAAATSDAPDAAGEATSESTTTTTTTPRRPTLKGGGSKPSTGAAPAQTPASESTTDESADE